MNTLLLIFYVLIINLMIYRFEFKLILLLRIIVKMWYKDETQKKKKDWIDWTLLSLENNV
jgi:hypothetical protein